MSPTIPPLPATVNDLSRTSVSDALNRLLQNLVLKSARADGVRDFFHVALIGYGGRVASAFRGPLAGRDLVPISEIANHPVRIEMRTRKVQDAAGALIAEEFRFPVWFEAQPKGKTPLPDDFARMLFGLSSELPPKLLEAAKAAGFSVGLQSRGFVFNADLGVESAS